MIFMYTSSSSDETGRHYGSSIEVIWDQACGDASMWSEKEFDSDPEVLQAAPMGFTLCPGIMALTGRQSNLIVTA